MKKLEYKLLPCVFCTIGLNSYIAGHNLVHATVQKLSSTNDSSMLEEQPITSTDNAPIIQNLNSK